MEDGLEGAVRARWDAKTTSERDKFPVCSRRFLFAKRPAGRAEGAIYEGERVKSTSYCLPALTLTCWSGGF